MAESKSAVELERLYVRKGISFGCVLATVISWSVNHSIWWAILHGICGWLYVIYWAIWGTLPWT